MRTGLSLKNHGQNLTLVSSDLRHTLSYLILCAGRCSSERKAVTILWYLKESPLPSPLAINSDYKRSLLDSLELFKGVLPDDVHELLQRCDRRDAAEGELLLSPGAKNEHVFIVLSGSLNIHVGSPETPVLATMDVGACVGEMSIIEDRDPSAFVIAAEESHLLLIHQSVLWEMVDASHEFAKNLLVVLSERVRSHNRVIADSFGELKKFERHAHVTSRVTRYA